jgi:benzoate-CoA ligase
MSTTDVAAPPERFNFAQYLLALNAERPNKTAFIDDHGSLSYASVADRVRRVAAGLRALGLRREERVLLLMHDGCDWPARSMPASCRWR